MPCTYSFSCMRVLNNNADMVPIVSCFQPIKCRVCKSDQGCAFACILQCLIFILFFLLTSIRSRQLNVKSFSWGHVWCRNWVRGHWVRLCSRLVFDKVCLYVRAELFQLVAVHLPQSGDQLVEARELSAVLSNVSSNSAAIVFGRGVHTPLPLLSLTHHLHQFHSQKWCPSLDVSEGYWSGSLWTSLLCQNKMM